MATCPAPRGKGSCGGEGSRRGWGRRGAGDNRGREGICRKREEGIGERDRT